MPTSYLRRSLVALLGSVVAVTGLTALAAPAQASFTSTVGGDITRSEVMERAQYWLDHQPGPYTIDGSGYSPDPTGSRNYRRDCSGYVDMAWHTSTDNTTYNMANISNVISRSDLQPGDILNDEQHHVILFKRWTDSSHTAFDYYSFGSTPVKLKTNISISAAEFDGHPNSEYVARRYIHIIDNLSARRVTSDFDGDGKSDPALFRPGTGEWMAVYGSGGGHSLASGWGGPGDIPVVGDYNGDGKTDIAMFRPSNGTWYEVDTGSGNP
ncbi:hypothetical protein ACGFI8_40260, partial [Dactylosporangium sp. NPDC048998]